MFIDYGGGASAVWNEDDYSENMEGVEFGAFVISFPFIADLD